MRLRGFPAGALAAQLVEQGEGRSASVGEASPLHGSWLATRWQYASRDEPLKTVDVVVDLGGVVTLSLSAGTWVLTWDVTSRGNQSMGGSQVIRGDQLEMVVHGSTETERVTFRMADGTLSLSSDESGWDFDGDGTDEAASLVAVFVRL